MTVLPGVDTGRVDSAGGDDDRRANVPSAEEGGAGSLKPVIDVIPAEAYDNPTWKGMSYFLRDLVLYLGSVVGLVLWPNPVISVPLIVLCGLAVSGLFVVAHDAAHGALFKSRRLNSVVGHVAMLPAWHVYEGWVLGHNRIHHGHTVRQGLDFTWHPYTPQDYAAMSTWRRLRHRYEWSWLGAGAYYIREVWWNKMIVGRPPDRWVKAIRRDRLIVGAFIACSSGLLGWLGWQQTGSAWGVLWMIVRVLVAPYLFFSYLMGSFVHVHHIQPDTRWWKRREWTKFKGQMEGTTILRAPRVLNFFVHWIMVHVPHHVDVRIPMYRLELAADAIKSAFPGVVHDAPLRFRDFVRNTRRCKLYDFETGEWLTYDEARARVSS